MKLNFSAGIVFCQYMIYYKLWIIHSWVNYVTLFLYDEQKSNEVYQVNRYKNKTEKISYL